MFKLVEEATYEWPVDVKLPSTTKPGTFETHRFFMVFVVVPTDEAKAIEAELLDAGTGADDAARADALLIRAARGWRDVVDEAGDEIPFSEPALKHLLQLTPIRLACYQAYTASLSGGLAGPRRGN